MVDKKSSVCEAAILRELESIGARLKADPDCAVPTPRAIADRVQEDTEEEVSESHIRTRLKEFLGMTLYKQKYGRTIDPAARTFLMGEIAKIKGILAVNSAAKVPTAAALARDCKEQTHKSVTATTVLVFLKQELGDELYDAKYGKGIDPVAEAFLREQIANIKAQWARDPDADFPTAVDLKRKLEKDKHITLVPRTIRKRLRRGLGKNIYSQLYGRDIPPAALPFFAAEVAVIRQQWAIDPDGAFSFPQALADKCKSTLQITVSAYLVRKYFRAQLGEDLYRDIYWMYLSADVEAFLATEIAQIQARWRQNPDGEFPSPQVLAGKCEEKFHEQPSISTIRARLLQQLEPLAYERLYGREIPDAAEQFLATEIQTILAQYRRDPTGPFPTALDIRRDLKEKLKIEVNEASIRKRLREQIEEPVYLDIFGREIPASAQAFLDQEMEKIREQYRQNPDGEFLTISDIVSRCKEGHHGIISDGVVRTRFQKGLGGDIYDTIYGRSLAPEAEAFLATEANQAMTSWKLNPNVDLPTMSEIRSKCLNTTGKKVSITILHDRFKALMGAQLYQDIYSRRISPLADAFLTHEIDKIRARWHRDPFGKFPSPHALAIRCEAKIHEKVSRNAIRPRLQAQLGLDIYDKIYGLGIDPAAEKFLATEGMRMKSLYMDNPEADLPTTEDLVERCKTEAHASISRFTVLDRMKQHLGAEVYAAWSATQTERSNLGRANHRYFEAILLRGHAELRSRFPGLPRGYCEVQLSPEARCDLLFPDVHLGGYLRDCLSRKLPDGRTWADVLGIPLAAADCYTDLIVDPTTRFSPAVVAEKAAKYCDDIRSDKGNGKVFLVVACTGQYPRELHGPVTHPYFPDAVGLPAAAVAEFLQVAPKYVYAAYFGVQLTLRKDKDRLESLADGLLPDPERCRSKAYHRYVRQRDPDARKVAEARAVQVRARMQGQQTLHEFGLDNRPQDSLSRPGVNDSASQPPTRMTPATRPCTEAQGSLPPVSTAPPDLGKFTRAVARLEDALRGARDSSAKLNDSLGTIEELVEGPPETSDAGTAPDRVTPPDTLAAPDVHVPIDSRADDNERAEMVAAVDKLAASDFDAGLDGGPPDRKQSKDEMLAAVDKFAKTNFDAGESKGLGSKSPDDLSQGDSIRSHVAYRTKG